MRFGKKSSKTEKEPAKNKGRRPKRQRGEKVLMFRAVLLQKLLGRHRRLPTERYSSRSRDEELDGYPFYNDDDDNDDDDDESRDSWGGTCADDTDNEEDVGGHGVFRKITKKVSWKSLTRREKSVDVSSAIIATLPPPEELDFEESEDDDEEGEIDHDEGEVHHDEGKETNDFYDEEHERKRNVSDLPLSVVSPERSSRSRSTTSSSSEKGRTKDSDISEHDVRVIDGDETTTDEASTKTPDVEDVNDAGSSVSSLDHHGQGEFSDSFPRHHGPRGSTIRTYAYAPSVHTVVSEVSSLSMRSRCGQDARSGKVWSSDDDDSSSSYSDDGGESNSSGDSSEESSEEERRRLIRQQRQLQSRKEKLRESIKVGWGEWVKAFFVTSMSGANVYFYMLAISTWEKSIFLVLSAYISVFVAFYISFQHFQLRELEGYKKQRTFLAQRATLLKSQNEAMLAKMEKMKEKLDRRPLLEDRLSLLAAGTPNNVKSLVAKGNLYAKMRREITSRTQAKIMYAVMKSVVISSRRGQDIVLNEIGVEIIVKKLLAIENITFFPSRFRKSLRAHNYSIRGLFILLRDSVDEDTSFHERFFYVWNIFP